MVENQLALISEEISELLWAVVGFKGVVLLDFGPRELSSKSIDLVSGLREGFFFREEFLTGCDPVGLRDDGVLG